MTRFIRTMPGPANELVYATVGRVPLRVAHAVLTAEQAETERRGYDMDDMGEHAMTHWSSLRAGLADRRLAQLADEERTRIVAESAAHMAHRPFFFDAGRNQDPPYAEMACAEPEDEPLSVFTLPGKLAIAAIAAVAVLVCWLAPLAG